MVTRILILALLVPPLNACGSDADLGEDTPAEGAPVSDATDEGAPVSNAADEGPAASEQAHEGGTTGDFSGIPSPCAASRQETLEDEPTLGFSVSDILGAVSGTFEFDAIWGAQCQFPPADRAENCGDEENTPYLLDQIESHIAVELAPTGAPAIVAYQAEDALPCGQSMTIPVSVSLSSEDGLLDEAPVVVELVSHCGEIASIGHRVRLDSIQGTLWTEAVGMAPEWEVTWDLQFVRDEVWFSLSVVPPGASTVIDLGDPANDAAVKTAAKQTLPEPDESNLFCAER